MGDKLRGDGLIAHQQEIDAHTKNPWEIVRVGAYYTNPEGYYNALTMVANHLYAKPFIVVRNMTLDQIAIDVTTAVADASMRLGIYNDGTNLYPGTLLLDAGVVSVATTGVKTITINQALTKGIYWVVCVGDGTPGVRSTIYAIQIPNILGLQHTALHIVYAGWDVTFTYGVLPTPFTAGGGLTYQIPRIAGRVASLD